MPADPASARGAASNAWARPGRGPAVAAVLALALAVPARGGEESGLSLGARVGYGLPVGEAMSGVSLGDVVSGQVPLQLDATWRLDRSWRLGLYAQYGFATVAGASCPAGAGCSGGRGGSVAACHAAARSSVGKARGRCYAALASGGGLGRGSSSAVSVSFSSSFLARLSSSPRRARRSSRAL